MGVSKLWSCLGCSHVRPMVNKPLTLVKYSESVHENSPASPPVHSLVHHKWRPTAPCTVLHGMSAKHSIRFLIAGMGVNLYRLISQTPSWSRLKASSGPPKQPMDRPDPQGQQQHTTSWFVEAIHRARSFGGDATVLADYALTTTTTNASNLTRYI